MRKTILPYQKEVHMGISNKSKHVGNHGGAYTDQDGMSRQFTMVDHDNKSLVFSNTEKADKEWDKKHRALLIERISKVSASICPEVFTDFVIKGDKDKIEWNMDMLLDNGMPLKQLGHLCTLLENKAALLKNNLL